MCGLVGFSKFTEGKLNPEKLKTLLYINSLTRGKDSTGIFTPSLGTIKSIHSADDFLISLLKSNKNFEEEIQKDSVFIGHVRQKTHGDKKKENAHPFTYGHVTGAHNGTLNNHLKLKKINDEEDYPVDSMILISRLNQDNNFNVLAEFDGAAALLFYNDLEPDTIYAFRNEDRPLYRGVIRDSGTFFSSIEEPLKIIGCESIEELKPNNVYTFKNGLFISTKKIVNKVSFKLLKNFHKEAVEDFIGFNLFLDKQIPYQRHISYDDNDNCYMHIKDFSYIASTKKKSEYAATCIKVEDLNKPRKEELEDDIQLTRFNVDSYNGFFQKHSYVVATATLFFKEKDEKIGKNIACIKDELFIITYPLTSKSGREVSIKSLARKDAEPIYVNVKYLQCLINKDQLDKYCELNNIPTKDKEKQKNVIELNKTIPLASLKALNTETVNKYLELFVSKTLTKTSSEPINTKDTKFLDDVFKEEIDNNISNFENTQEEMYKQIYQTFEDVIKLCNSLGSLLPSENYKELEIDNILADCDSAISLVSNLYEEYTIAEADKI